MHERKRANDRPKNNNNNNADDDDNDERMLKDYGAVRVSKKFSYFSSFVRSFVRPR